MLSGFGHDGRSPSVLVVGLVGETDCLRLSGGVFFISFPFLPPPRPIKLSLSRGPQDTISTVLSFARVGLPLGNTCGGKNTKITRSQSPGNSA